MAGLIVKSPYIKCGQNIGGYLRYIATRERVEILPDDRPPTQKQTELVQKLARDFPKSQELLEYQDYQASPTKARASAFLTRALEENWDKVSQSEVYMRYIATRPRAERLGGHGLFGDEDGVDLQKAMAELEHYEGNVWTHILSLHRADAERLGFNNTSAWRNLLRAHRSDIAAAMNIPPQDFHWYAAFHNEGDHPHVHMMAWPAKPGQGYLSRDGIRQIKSTLTNDIFKQDLLHIYEEKSSARDVLIRETRRAMVELTQQMAESVCGHAQAEQRIFTLAQSLGTVKGRKSYGYLPKPLKKQVDEIVELLERLPTVDACYQKWWELQCELEQFYSGKEKARPPLSQQKVFRAIKNGVIQEAEHIRLGQISFEDSGMEEDITIDDRELSWPCLELLGMTQNQELPLSERDRAAADLEQLAIGGNPHAQYFLGILYRDGGLLIPDAERARHWLEQAARQELPAAGYALGRLYLSEDPDVRDPAKGIQWLETAAHGGSSPAAYRLGKVYLRGEDAPKDTAKAVEYLRQAAEGQDPQAQYLLGKLYLMGEGVPQDKNAAYAWFCSAAEQGHTCAQFFVDRFQAQQERPPELMLSVTRLLHHMSRIFRENVPDDPDTGRMHIDRKRLQKLREMKLAAGHMPDDHEEQGLGGMSMG